MIHTVHQIELRPTARQAEALRAEELGKTFSNEGSGVDAANIHPLTEGLSFTAGIN